jgi:hypothetical protein
MIAFKIREKNSFCSFFQRTKRILDSEPISLFETKRIGAET